MGHPCRALVLYARAPRLGIAKTRMLPWLEPFEALELHRALLEDSLGLLRRAAARAAALPFLALSEPWTSEADPEEAGLRAAAVGLTLLPQQGADLGERLLGTFRLLLEERGHSSVVIFGADSPTLPPDRFGSAYALLRSPHDLVLGPSEDGGYYLIGARRVTVELFAGIPWGTERAREATLRAASRAGRRIALLPPWYDVDRPEDLLRLRRDLSAPSPPRARRTAAFIEGLARAGRIDPQIGGSGRRPLRPGRTPLVSRSR